MCACFCLAAPSLRILLLCAIPLRARVGGFCICARLERMVDSFDSPCLALMAYWGHSPSVSCLRPSSGRPASAPGHGPCGASAHLLLSRLPRSARREVQTKAWDGDGVPLKDSNCAGIGTDEDKAHHLSLVLV